MNDQERKGSMKCIANPSDHGNESDLSNEVSKFSSNVSEHSGDHLKMKVGSASSDTESFPRLSDGEKVWLDKFRQRAEEVVTSNGLTGGMGLAYIADQIGLDVTILRKDVALTYVLWIELLTILQKHLDAETAFKYKTQDAFLEEYKERFSSEKESEKTKLFKVANWMNIAFKMIPV